MERADCTLEQYIGFLEEWAEGLYPERVEANGYLHKSFVPARSKDEDHVYALWLRVQGKSMDMEVGKSEPFRETYDVILFYRKPEDLEPEVKNLKPFLDNLFQYIRDRGIYVSNLPEFFCVPEGFTPEDPEDFELRHDDSILFDIIDEMTQSEKVERDDGPFYSFS